ncbi:MAG: molecular chaperone TorD family protein, partial [Marinobacter sp.]
MTANAPLWQEAWAILAQAWRPPTAEAQCQALRECLAGDISGLGKELGLELDTRDLADSLAEVSDQALLVGYSRLFLAPPYAAHLDLGSGVDGEQMGSYAQAMMQTLTDLALQLPEDSHEHPDYLPVMLEVALHLETEDAPDRYRQGHLEQLAKGLEPLCQSLGERTPDSLWYQLASLTDSLVRARLKTLGASEPSETLPSAAAQRREQRDALTTRVQQAHLDEAVPDRAATRAKQAGIPPEAMLEMIANLEAQGLDASHLRGQLPGEGWASMIPP